MSALEGTLPTVFSNKKWDEDPLLKNLKDKIKKDLARQKLFLRPEAQPASFIAKALFFAATSNFFNPINANQSRLSRYLGKPLRAIARIVYSVAVSLLFAPFGIFYHLGAAIWFGIKGSACKDGSLKYRAWEHLEAAAGDFVSLFLIHMFEFALDPHSATAHCFNRSAAPLIIGKHLMTGTLDDKVKDIVEKWLSKISKDDVREELREFSLELAIVSGISHQEIVQARLDLRELLGRVPSYKDRNLWVWLSFIEEYTIKRRHDFPKLETSFSATLSEVLSSGCD